MPGSSPSHHKRCSILSFLTKVASGYWHVFDPQCGFIAITAPTLRRLKLDGVARDYFFENDMLIRLNVIDARVVDVDTSSLCGDETSHVRIGRVGWTFPPRLLRGTTKRPAGGQMGRVPAG